MYFQHRNQGQKTTPLQQYCHSISMFLLSEVFGHGHPKSLTELVRYLLEIVGAGFMENRHTNTLQIGHEIQQSAVEPQ
jgi:hypothetical protein